MNTENRDMMAATVQAVAEDNAYQAALNAGMLYAILCNDCRAGVRYYATWQDADRANKTLNAGCDADTKYWVEAI